MFPADEGDCLLLTFGAPDAPRHILIDGGTPRTYARLRPRLLDIAAANEPLDAVVVTHIDADHIGGILALANDPNPPIVPHDIWFNTFDAIEQASRMGERQAEDLARRLKQLDWPLNHAFGGRAVFVDDELRHFDFRGLDITVLSPDPEKCRDLNRRWQQWRDRHPSDGIQKMGGPRPVPAAIDVMAAATPSPEDSEPPNGSSIALLVEYEGKALLLGADSHPDLLEKSLRDLAGKRGVDRISVDLYKVSHHGSSGNTTAGLCDVIECERYAISTSGARHHHPDDGALARLLLARPDATKTIYFNYRTRRTCRWDDAELRRRYQYNCKFPDGDNTPVVIDL